MKPERWQQIDNLLQSALARAPAERSAFLAQACAGDEPLRHEVESLIASHEDAGSLLDTPMSQIAADLLVKVQAGFVAGQKIGPYKIVDSLGAGGMGEVYLAEDPRLGRKIALKLLPAYFTRDSSRLRRFEQEARAASSLNHPNIVTIYEIGEADNHHFIASEFIDGMTLRERMTASQAAPDRSAVTRTQLKLSETLDLAVQIGEALAAAHAAGIVHRDIKPENIMVRHDAYVKVLDFGLAKLTERPAFANIDTEAATRALLKTNPGIVMGTVRYMSPEQARGLPVDERTDVWSLGVVLYEMATAQAPFEGETATDVILSIVEREPPPLARYTKDAPAELERIVSKALRKNKEERYQTAKDLALDLKNLKQELEVQARLERSIESGTGRTETTATSSAQMAIVTGPQTAGRTVDVGTASPTSSIEYLITEVKHHKRTATLAAVCVTIALAVLGYYSYFAKGGEAIDSIAVLPFVNVSNDSNAEYLSDGLTDSIINSLSQLPNLKKVIALNSVLRYKGKQTDPQAIGRELNVRAVLMGRLVQRGDELLISTELVDVKDNKRLWGGQYDRKLADVLKLRAEIAQEISERLRLKLTGEEKQRLAKPETDNPEAYQLYLKGRFLRRNRVSVAEAITYLEQAIKLDPNFAAAYAQLAYAYSTMAWGGGLPPNEARQKMNAAITRGLEIDNTNGELHATLGLARAGADRDLSGAIREFQRAVELDPNSADVHTFYARVVWSWRRFDEAILHMRRAQELDPLSPALCTDLGKILYSAGQRDQAIEQYRKALVLNPNYSGAHHHLSNAYLAEGKYEEAIAEIIKSERASGEKPLRSGQVGYVYGVAGRRAEAEKILHELEELSKQRYVSPVTFALIYTGLGDKDRAFEYLQKQFEENTQSLSFLQVHPEWDSLRSDPRFAKLLQSMNF